MDYLVEDAVEFFEDFLPHGRGEVAPDLLGRRSHASFSFTKASRARTASAVNLERIVVFSKWDQWVHCSGKRSAMSPR